MNPEQRVPESSSILIVDDEPGIVRLLERALRGDGFTNVVTTTDPVQFLKRFDSDPPDLVILDLVMPKLSGHEVLVELSSKIAPEEFLPRIVLTGETDIEPRQRALSSGATEFLTKPIDMIEIVLRVRNLLATRGLHLALREEKRSLEVKVEERTRELKRANEELVDRMSKLLEAEEQRKQAEQELLHAVKVEALGQMAASVAHDFNNLLTVILSFAGFASEELDEDHPAAADVREIKGAARSGSMLTRQLLMFSRKDPPRLEILQPDVVIEEIRGLLGAALRGRHRLDLDLSAPRVRVRMDRGHLEQVLMNLTVNARDAMTEPGVLTIRTSLEEGSEEGARAGRRWSVTVTDTGTGMSEEVRSKVFDPFFTTKPEGQGTGLGLATVQRVIERAGGSIRIESSSGTGTTFWISLPLVAAEIDQPRHEGPESTKGRGERVVVVAEEDALRRAMDRILSTNGYAAIVCGTGREALEGPLSDGAPPALLITDVLAGDMSGVELASRCSLPTLFMSTYAEDVLHSSDILDSEAVLLMKPFEPADLLTNVRSLLDD